jgi:hypothetical protein
LSEVICQWSGVIKECQLTILLLVVKKKSMRP